MYSLQLMAREIEAMLAEGKTQREVAEHFGFKDTYVVKRLLGRQRERSFGTYGYRRMWLWLKSQNIHRNPKTVLRVMKKYDLLSEIRRRRKWRQMGQQLHRYENLLNREFHADRPNSNSIVAHKTGTRQTVNLVLDTIHMAVKQEKKAVAKELQLHSDQSGQYTSQEHFNLAQAGHFYRGERDD